MALVWPWSVVDPLNPFRAIEYFSHFFEKPWQELFGGVLISVPDMPRSYVPTLLALKLPEIFLAARLARRAGALVAAFRRDIAAPTGARSCSLVALAALLPIAVTVARGRRCTTASGISCSCCRRSRCSAALPAPGHRTARARDLALRALAALPSIFVAGMALPVVDMARLHPYEYAHFNWLAGGVARARDRYMLDYWGLAFKQASQEPAGEARRAHESKPAGRRWKIAVCGPHRSPQVALGPDFETDLGSRRAPTSR